MQELCSCKNKFLFYPSCQNVTIPQHVDQKRVKDVTHNNTTCNKESLLPLMSAAPLICCPLRLAKSFSWRVRLSSFHRTHLVWLVVVLLPGGLPLPLSWRLHLFFCPQFVGCCMASVVTPVTTPPPPLIRPLHIFALLHPPLVWLIVVSHCLAPGLPPPFSLRRLAPLGVLRTTTTWPPP